MPTAIAVMYAGQVVESGTADQIFYHCAHPYTRGLLESIPRLNAAHDARLTYIGGTPPGRPQSSSRLCLQCPV